MYQVIGAAFWLAAGIFIGNGDPIVGLLAVLCGIVWVASMPTTVPLDAPRKPRMLIRME
jgi:hypothetical protein